jgi:hypothetical protein
MHGPINVKSPNNIRKWQMEFNSAFKGLNNDKKVAWPSLCITINLLNKFIFFKAVNKLINRLRIEIFAYVVTIHKTFTTFFDTTVLSNTSQWMPHVFLPGKRPANWQLLSLGLILPLKILTLLIECKLYATYCGCCALSPIALLTTRATCSATQRVTCKKVYILLLQVATKQKFR